MNLLIISLDSVRLDRLSHPTLRLPTPQFDRATQDFVFSDRFFSPSVVTRAVHTSLFTGFYPFEHGVLGQNIAKMRPGLPHIFSLFEASGARGMGFSEAAEIFTGLDYAPWIHPLSLNPLEGLNQLAPCLHGPGNGPPQLLFLHYWSAHAPYGAADNRAFGQTAQLLKTGHRHEVIRRYDQAVVQLLEHKIAPLLDRLDLANWAVFIFSDHGERWAADEFYHGQSLKNSVLRVPLFYHVPNTGRPTLPRPLYSLLDLFPTWLNLFELPADYRGYGRDIRQEEATPFCLAEIEPTPQPSDLAPTTAGLPLVGIAPRGFQWALFDQGRKYTWNQAAASGHLEDTFAETALAPVDHTYWRTAYEKMKAASAVGQAPLQQASAAEEKLLEDRLSDLGYL